MSIAGSKSGFDVSEGIRVIEARAKLMGKQCGYSCVDEVTAVTGVDAVKPVSELSKDVRVIIF